MHAQRAAMMKKHPVGVSIAKRRMKKKSTRRPTLDKEMKKHPVDFSEQIDSASENKSIAKNELHSKMTNDK